MYDIIIIGAGTAGLTASIYAARAGKKVLLLESETIGGQISSSPEVENYPGIKRISGAEFSNILFEQATELGVDFELEKVTEVLADPHGGKTVKTEYNIYEGRCLILATGVKHRKLEIEKEDFLFGKGVSYCAICDGAFFKNKTVAVVGGGNTALQNAELLSGICQKVYLIHRRDTFRGEAHLVKVVEEKENIEILLNRTVKALESDEALSGLILQSTAGEEDLRLQTNGLFISIGQVPENQQFANIVSLDPAGYIMAGEDCRTSAEGIFAAGDCRTKEVRQLTTAAADGAVAALAACQYVAEHFPG